MISEKIKKIKREFYIEASAKYFEEFGYENAKIADLAKSLDVSVGTLYKMFDTKENLYFEYIVYQLNSFVKKLNENSTDDPMFNLKLYLQYKYKPFINNRKSMEYKLTNDPFFFHKMNMNTYHPMDGVYEYLEKQLRPILNNDNLDYKHLAILFKKLADGYTESYMIKKFNTDHIVEETINIFFNGITKYSKKH